MNCTRTTRSFCARATPLLFLLVATTGQAGETARLALDGFCPVSITAEKAWKPGDAGLATEFDGRTYRFATEELRDRFLASPDEFVPMLGGDCIVTYETTGRRVPGWLAFGTFYEGRLLLFASAEARETFRTKPGVFASADLAYGGRSPVALVDRNRTVRGKREYTLFHRGFRYRFATPEGRAKFLDAPDDYAVEKADAEVAAAEKQVTVTGKSACAFCDHKVWPLLTEGELGLAIKADDGTLYIVEHADTKFPTLYNDRFDGVVMTVSGREIKRQGSTIWIVPDSLVAGT